MDKVKHVILVLSGKGGVGKSTVSTQLALTLKEFGFKVFSSFSFSGISHRNKFLHFQVGILDIDLCGPSVAYLLGLENADVHQCEEGWVNIQLIF